VGIVVGLVGLLAPAAAHWAGRAAAARALRAGGWLAWEAPLGKRLLVAIAGGAASLTLASLLMTAVYAGWGAERPTDQTIVAEVLLDEPAGRAGLQVGDEILAADGAALRERGDLSAAIERGAGAPLRLEVLRDGRRSAVELTPVLLDGKYRIGIRYAGGTRRDRLSLGRALVEGARFPTAYSREVARGLGDMLFARGTVEPAGPVAIVRAAAAARPAAAPTALTLIAASDVWVGWQLQAIALLLALIPRRRRAAAKRVSDTP
jgi:regulator of sigma E protease